MGERLRLDKLLADTGRWSRREVKELIRQGRVTVNGQAARGPEEKYEAGCAALAVDGLPVLWEPFTWLMLHKPAGLLSATEDRRQATVLDLLPEHLRRLELFPVGRLDKDTTGLLLLTNDGAWAQHLLHPKHEVEKTYHVSVFGPVAGAAARLAAVTDLEGESIRPARVEVLRKTPGTAVLAVTIHEGKNRQVRRMCAQCGLTVKRLRRVREGALELGDLPPGKWRYLTQDEAGALGVTP